MNINLVKAGDEDIAKLIDIEREAADQKTYSPILTEDEWKKELKKNLAFFIEYNNEIVGSVCFEIRSSNEIYISGIVILKKYRGRGIAEKTLLHVMDMYKGYNFSLVTHPDNPALFLYQKLGFKVGERIENYFGDGEPRVKLFYATQI